MRTRAGQKALHRVRVSRNAVPALSCQVDRTKLPLTRWAGENPHPQARRLLYSPDPGAHNRGPTVMQGNNLISSNWAGISERYRGPNPLTTASVLDQPCWSLPLCRRLGLAALPESLRFSINSNFKLLPKLSTKYAICQDIIDKISQTGRTEGQRLQIPYHPENIEVSG